MQNATKAFLIALAVAVGVTGGSFAQAASTPFSAVQASGTEFRLNLSRNRIAPSRLRLEFVNFGEDDHDLAVRRFGTSLVRNLGTTRPGERSVERFKVRKGTYTLWCTISDHRARGMKATLKVR